MELNLWLAGLFVAIVLGGLVTATFLYALRGVLALGAKPKEKIKRVPPWLTGVVERFVFAIFVGLDMPGVLPAMMGWLAIKLATNWNKKDMETTTSSRPFAFSALLAGLISMLFATLGGLVCRGELWVRYVPGI